MTNILDSAAAAKYIRENTAVPSCTMKEDVRIVTSPPVEDDSEALKILQNQEISTELEAI